MWLPKKVWPVEKCVRERNGARKREREGRGGWLCLFCLV